MTRYFKIIALAAILAMAMTSAFAQELPASPVSPTQIATAGVFATEVEDSMDVHNYGTVEFEKRAGFVGVQDGMASLGYAFKAGGLYIGLWYNGNFMSFDTVKQEYVLSTYDLNTQLLSSRLTRTSILSDSISSNNSIQALIGVAGMGIKVGFKEDLTTWTNPDGTYETTQYFNGAARSVTGKTEKFSRAEGVLTPSVEWGMSIGKIRPKVILAFGIGLDNMAFDTRGNHTLSDEGKIIGNTETITHNGRNMDFLAPRALVGAEYDLKENVTVGISYELGLDIYDNKYSAAGFSGSVSGVVTNYTGSTATTKELNRTQTVRNAQLTLQDMSYMSHTITPTFYTEAQAGEGVKLGFYAELPVSIIIDTVGDEYTKGLSETKVVRHDDKFLGSRTLAETVTKGGVTETTSLVVSPLLAIGASYALIPNKFTVNAGIAVKPFDFTNATANYSKGRGNHQTVTTTTYDADGKELTRNVTSSIGTTDETTDSQTVTNTWDNFSIAASAGFKFNFGQNMALDMAVNGGTESGDFVLNLTSVNVLFAFKF